MFVLLAASIFAAAPVYATTVTWTGAVDHLWTTPGNWAGGAPVAGDRLVFPSSASHLANSNNFPVGTTFFDITFLGGGYTLSGNTISLSDGINDSAGGNTIATGVKLAASQTVSAVGFLGLTLAGTVDLGVHTLTLGSIQVTGPIIGSGSVVMAGYTRLAGNNSHTGSTQINGSGASIDGVLSPSSLQINSGYLYGSGTLSDVTVNGYAILAGANFASFLPKIITTGNLTYTPTFSAFYANLNGTTAGVNYEQIVVHGSVDLGTSVSFYPYLGFTPTVGQSFLLIDNDGVDAVSGTFSGLSEGATFDLSGNTFVISYAGGSGNDVVLTCVSAANNWTGAVSGLWSVAGNWSNGVPWAGDTLYFPAGAAHPTNHNDLPLTVFHKIVFTGGGYNLGGNPIALDSGVSDQTGGNTISADLLVQAPQVVSSSSFLGLTLTGQVDLGANTLTLGGVDVIGNIVGTGSLVLGGYSRLHGTDTYSGSTQINSTGASMDGSSISSLQVNSGYLYGNGVVGDVAVNGYSILPGGNFGSTLPKQITTGNLVYNPSFAAFYANLNGTVAGTHFEQIVVHGTVDLGSTVTLYPSLGFMPSVGQTFVLIDNDGVDPVSGTFSGLAEGATITLTGNTFAVSYMGGTGNDVVLTCTATANMWTGAVNNLWSVAGNWTNGVPGAGDTLYFPPSGIHISTINDLPSTTFGSIVFTGSGYTLGGNPIYLSNGISDQTFGPNTVSANVHVVASQTISSGGFQGLTLSGQTNLGANTLTLSGVYVSGPIVGSGGVVVAGYTRLVGSKTYLGPTTVNGTGVSVDGTLSPSSLMVNSGYLYGNGTVGDVTINGYAILPGGNFGSVSPRSMTTGNLTYGPGFSAFYANLNGATGGISYEQLVVNGQVDLGAVTYLYPALGFTPASGQIFVLVNNDGNDPVIGSFAGLPEGTVFNIGPYPFKISYIGKTGNDVILISLSGDPLNKAPIAVEDSYSTIQDVPLAVPAAGVLSNDSDPDLNPISVILYSPASAHGGVVVVNPNGSVSYTPPSGFTGTDTFTYIISDGHDATDMATVTVLVEPPPTATPTSTSTSTRTSTPTSTPTSSATPTSTPSQTSTPTSTASGTPTPTETPLPPTATPTYSATPLPTLVPGSVVCSLTPMSAAGAFNVFVLGNADVSGSDIEGQFAVGGHASIFGYSVGLALPNSNGARDDLVVGGNVAFASGRVENGNLVYGGTATLTSLTLPHGSAFPGSPINFASAAMQLQTLSSSLGLFGPNATTSVVYYGPRAQISLVGTDPQLNIFSLNGNDLAAANSVSINVPPGSSALLNVNGNVDQLSGFGMALSGISASKILFNFYQATSLTIQHIGVTGSVLAPFAHVSFNSANFSGQLVAGNLTGNGQANQALFDGCRPQTSSNPLVTRSLSSPLDRLRRR